MASVGEGLAPRAASDAAASDAVASQPAPAAASTNVAPPTLELLPPDVLLHLMDRLAAPELCSLLACSRMLLAAADGHLPRWLAEARRRFAQWPAAWADPFSPMIGVPCEPCYTQILSTSLLSSGCELGRPAYERPTVGGWPRPALGRGRIDLTELSALSRAVRSRIHIVEADLASLPYHVDLLAVPANEWLADPGFGALSSVCRAGGEALSSELSRARTKLRGGVLDDPPVSLLGDEWSHEGGPEHDVVAGPGSVVLVGAAGLAARNLALAIGVQAGDLVECGEQLREGWLSDLPPLVSHPPSRRVGWLLEQKVNAQVRLTRRIFHLAALHGAASVGIPGISTGARRFPKAAAAEIAAFVAVDEVVASGLTLDVHLVSNDDRSDAGYMRDDFERAVEVALRSVGQRECSPGARVA